ncbi:MAG: YitT family protein, partial [Bacilli bacterium]|nr:YitT family protein [Bacilli bacterium]
LAYKGDFSAGGVDIIAYYIGLKKKTLVGSYAVILNGATLLVFILLSITKEGWGDADMAARYVVGAFYTAIYLFVTKLVVDAINTRNKKVKVEVVSSKEALGDVLIESFPHAATKLKGKGVYSGKEKFVFIMVISSDELNAVMRLIQREDNDSFVEVMPLISVAGRFFTKPIK